MIRGPRSEICGKRAYVRFLNKTSLEVDLIWLDFSGRQKVFKTLGKDQFLDVNTFIMHPWMAVSHHSKKNLYIEGQIHHYPPASITYFRKRYPDVDIPDDFETRTIAVITVPLFSLKYTALLAVRRMLRQSSDAEELDLPKKLIAELQEDFETLVD
nr:protein Vhl [Leptinotarsa decemlineata]